MEGVVGGTLMPSVCSRLWRLCRLGRLCKLCELCRMLLDVRLWQATGVLIDVLSSMLPDLLFGVLPCMLFNAKLWLSVDHYIGVLGERLSSVSSVSSRLCLPFGGVVVLLLDHCVGFLGKGVLGRVVAAEACSTGPAPGILGGSQFRFCRGGS